MIFQYTTPQKHRNGLKLTMIFLGICRGHAGDLPDSQAEPAALREAPHAAARAAAEAQGGSGLSEQSEKQPREAGWNKGW